MKNALATLSLVIALTACGGGPPGLAAGRYSLADTAVHARKLADRLVDLGKIRPSQREAAYSRLRWSSADLNLADDHTFTLVYATRGMNGEISATDEFSGTWKQLGTSIELHETEHNDRSFNRTTTGQSVGDRLTIATKRSGSSFEFHLQRRPIEATPPR